MLRGGRRFKDKFSLFLIIDACKQCLEGCAQVVFGFDFEPVERHGSEEFQGCLHPDFFGDFLAVFAFALFE